MKAISDIFLANYEIVIINQPYYLFLHGFLVNREEIYSLTTYDLFKNTTSPIDPIF